MFHRRIYSMSIRSATEKYSEYSSRILSPRSEARTALRKLSVMSAWSCPADNYYLYILGLNRHRCQASLDSVLDAEVPCDVYFTALSVPAGVRIPANLGDGSRESEPPELKRQLACGIVHPRVYHYRDQSQTPNRAHSGDGEPGHQS